MHVILDVSRLLLSVHRPSPSGIDRVEMAYARHWLSAPPDACTFVVQSPWGWFGAVDRARVAALTQALGTVWAEGAAAARHAASAAWRIAAAVQLGLAAGAGRGALRDALARHRRPVFLLVSHRALDQEAPIAALRRAGAAFVPMLHDLIPLTHPEYARAPQVGRHARRIAVAARLADGILANSAATAATFAAHLPPGLSAPPRIAVAPLGTDAASPGRVAPPAGAPPYFVCLGTIEPRKNHLLLLHLWRALASEQEQRDPPRLVLIGRRGWENENILDLLERCTALRGGLVQEAGALPDRAVAGLLAGARALLFPSFAEGYGLPLAEALAAGVPALCSDIPALREVGGAVPDYLDPLDGPAWRAAILDHARLGSPMRAAQLARLAGWQAPRWKAHFAVVEDLLAEVAQRARAVRPVAAAGAAGDALLPAPAARGAVAAPAA